MPPEAPAPASAPVSRRARFLGLLAVSVLVAGALGAWFFQRPRPVAVVVVQPSTLVRTLQVSAHVATVSRVEVGATITGRVRRVLVTEGARVQAGQPLIELEEDELRAALGQARASEMQAAATLRNAREELQRVQALVAQGFVTASRADDARRAVDVAQAQEGAARAATEAARARLAQTRIVAPRAAQVLARHVEPGQIVQAGKPLLSLALAGPTQLVAAVDERFLEQLQVGQRADVVADAFPQRRFTARVASLGPAIDPQRGAVEVKFDLTGEAPAFLREDLTVSVEVETGRREQALVLPLSALREGDAAWVVRDGRLQVQPLRLGLRTLQAVEVTEGLAVGDAVTVGDTARLGQRVRPRPAAPLPAGAASVPAADLGGAIRQSIGR